jgi:thiol-disulfide isomerase/thioredoxin
VKASHRRFQLLSVGAVLVMIAVFAWSRSDGDQVDKLAPDPSGNALHLYKLLALDGSSVKLDRYRGKPLVVNFWRQDCAPCRQEMPAFDEISRTFGSQVAVVGVNSGDDLKTTKNYVEEVKVAYDILRDPGMEYVAGQEVLAWPTTLFVNAQGQIVSTHVGPMTVSDISNQIKGLLP